MTEVWRPVPGFETHYEVSDQGNVRSIDREIVDTRGVHRHMKGKDLSPAVRKCGHRFVNLQRGDTPQTVINIRQIVAAAFLGHPMRDPSKIIFNRNGDPADDRAENLFLRPAAAAKADIAAVARASIQSQDACNRGHRYEGANTFAGTPPGRNRCRACTLARSYVRYHNLPKSEVAMHADRYYRELTGASAIAA
ncbi:HNH endonuclease [Gordonia phage Mollymur]|uniref:HNH endonuclease n=1 Tax=Gordonia phage Mollymur TaxID=2590895 RepID=A0A4Y6EBL1_9CAUD|nr:HNH endonuclease [Gordonia phage Mollymur]QDF15462.1 HNH endonuclease [Gordonia phage Mollymur]